MRSTYLLGKVLIASEILIALTCSDAFGIASFARKEGVNCMTCHTVVPKLNRTGFEYRSAGYRMPDKIGKDETSKDLGHMMSFRAAVSESHTEVTNTTTANLESATGGSLYALTGSWGTNFGSLVEVGLSTKTSKGYLAAAPGTVTVAPQVSVSDLQFRAVYGEADSHWNFRIGQMPLTEGFGAGDRQLAASISLAPLAPTTTANTTNKWSGKKFNTGTGSSPGVEVGYTYFNTEVALATVNGYEYDVVDQTLHAYGNGYSSRDAADPLYNKQDTFFRFNQFIGKNNSVGGYVYQGAVSLPLKNDSKQGTYTAATYDTDKFSRVAFNGTYTPMDSLTLMAGVVNGTDAFSTMDTAKSSDAFVAADYYLNETSAAGFRYDSANQSNDDGFKQSQYDVYYTQTWKSGLYVKANYTFNTSGAGVGAPTVETKKIGLNATYMF